MVYSAVGFPQLKSLHLCYLRKLEEWMVDDGAMPNVSTIQIECCNKLEMLPDGFRFLTALRVLNIVDMPEDFRYRVQYHSVVDGGIGEERGVSTNAMRQSKTTSSTTMRRMKSEGAVKKAALGFRVFGFLFCLISFLVMAADRGKGWTLDSVDGYIEFSESQKIVEEKQRKIDGSRRSLQVLRSACIVWPNSASEVLLTGSFDGWTTQRKMEKSRTGIFSVCLELYPGRHKRAVSITPAMAHQLIQILAILADTLIEIQEQVLAGDGEALVSFS